MTLISSCSGVFYQPDRNLYYPPTVFRLDYREIHFKSYDGKWLFGWFLPAEKKPVKGTIIQFHGNAENISSHYITLNWAVKHGYNLFTFDYRGYGRSEGSPTQEGVYHDGLAGLAKAWELHQEAGGGKFIVYGQSLGGAIALRSLVDFERRDKIDLVVMESTFVSYQDLAQEKLASFWLTWIFSPLGQLLISDEYASEKVLSRLKNPLLVIHDRRDPVIGFEHGQRLFDLAPQPKKLWTEDNGKHVGVFDVNKPENRLKFIQILDALPVF